MVQGPEGEERPCLHCMMVELIEDFLSEYPVAPSVSDKVDTGEADEVIVAVAKTVARTDVSQHAAIRQHWSSN